MDSPTVIICDSCSPNPIDGLSTAALSFLTSRPPHAALRLTEGAHLPTVLIDDDHAAVRTAVRERFETSFLASVVCGEAENGADAILKGQKLKPDLIVLDLPMPVMDGFEAAKALRRLFPATQIVMLTAHYMETTKQAALLAGITEVFSKHQDLSPLIAHARAVFGMCSVVLGRAYFHSVG